MAERGAAPGKRLKTGIDAAAPRARANRAALAALVPDCNQQLFRPIVPHAVNEAHLNLGVLPL
jgi:hypothetical protein